MHLISSAPTSFLVAIAFVVIIWGLSFVLFSYSTRWLLELHEAAPLPDDLFWLEVDARVKSLAIKARVPKPEIFVVREFAANVLVLPMRGNCGIIVMSEGLIHSLTGSELDAVLASCLAQLKLRDFRYAAFVALCFSPLYKFLSFLPMWLGFILFQVPAFIMRLFMRKKRFFKADQWALRLNIDPRDMVAALQKLSALAMHLPPRNWTYFVDHLFWVSPMQTRLGVLHLFPTHPTVDARIEKILKTAR